MIGVSLSLLVPLLLTLASGSNVCSIADHKGNVTLAMEACCALGGGQVLVPSGTWTSNPFSFACNHLELRLDEGALLLASPDKTLYRDSTPRFIYAESKTAIGITGTGTIDGSGSAWWSQSSTHSHPYLIYLYKCDTVTVRDVRLQNSAKLTLVPKPCDNVRISNVTIVNPYTSSSRNLDCIDPAGNNIHISDCHLECGDDNVAVKGPASNVLVENCYFGTGHGASIGSITDTLVRNVTFRNIVMNGTDNGCRIKTSKGYSGGRVTDITFQNITMTNVKHPLVITGAYSVSSSLTGSSSRSSSSDSGSAAIDHILFDSVRATLSHDGSTLECTSDEPCRNVTLFNVITEPENKKPTCSNVHGAVRGSVLPETLAHCILQ